MIAKQPFQAQVSPQDHAAVIDLHGELNAFAEEELEKAYDEAEKIGFPVILLNFSDVSYINSTGIALIVNLLRRARQKQIQLVAYGLSEHYQEIFNITRLTDYLRVVTSDQGLGIRD